MRQKIRTLTGVAASCLVLCAVSLEANAVLLISASPDTCAFDTLAGQNLGSFDPETGTCHLTANYDAEVQPVVFQSPDVTLDLDNHTIFNSLVVFMVQEGARLTNGHFVDAIGCLFVASQRVSADHLDFTAAPELPPFFDSLGEAIGMQGAHEVDIRHVTFTGFFEGVHLGFSTDVTLAHLRFTDLREYVDIHESSGVVLSHLRITMADRVGPVFGFPLSTIEVRGDQVLIEHVDVDRSNTTSYGLRPCLGIGFWGSASDVVVDHFKCELEELSPAEPLAILSASNVAVTNSRFVNGLWVAVDFFAQGLVLIQDNRFDNLNSVVGIVIDPVPLATVVIERNQINHVRAYDGFWGVLVRFDASIDSDVTVSHNHARRYEIGVCLESVSGTGCGLGF